MKILTRRNVSAYSFVLIWQLLVSAACAQGRPVIQSSSVYWLGNNSSAYEILRPDGLKTYYLKTDAPLRDNLPATKEARIEENSFFPYTRTQSPLFDSLFTLAMQEVGESSVSTITDYAFEDARCECFETGEKWRYVWTRDTAYATELGLAALDPVRSMNSLLFKISGFRNNMSGEQIVQDTGSGGSWPISTDRVVWSLGAFETLKHLPYQSQAYTRFLHRSYNALKNTVITDRFAVYDLEDGLYTGEQSFLDWREQSYPEWTAAKVVHIGMSKSLSTNVVHYMALVRLVELAREVSDDEYALTFQNWATDLKASINKHFWDGISYRSIKTTYLDQRASKYYDLLGISLAVISGVASKEQASLALNGYPQTQVGAPVIWPQRQEVPIYHNRAIWPFVTAYALKAAKKIEDPYLISSFIRSLVVGPAQNLSHMENYEFTTMRNYYRDGNLSGPVVNSRRQLWSVAGYAGMVMDVIFGKEVRNNKIRFSPALTLSVRRSLFSASKNLELINLKFQGKKLKVVLELPDEESKVPEIADALFTLAAVSVNGKKVSPGTWIETDALTHSLNEIRLTMALPKSAPISRMVRINVPESHLQLSTKERQYLYAPRTPVLSPVGFSDNSPLLSFHSLDNESIAFHIYKNGVLLAKTDETYYLDRGHPLDKTACYSIVAVYRTGNESFPSEPFCYWPTGSIQHYQVNGHNMRNVGGAQIVSSNGRVFLHEWGQAQQKLQLEKVAPARTGTFAIQVEYTNNDKNNTGITCGVKKILVINERTGEVIKNSVITLPHLDGGGWTDSSFVPVFLIENNTYTILIEDFFNMSYLNHFKTYRFRGGKQGMYNMVNLAEIKVLYLGNQN